MAVSYTHLLTAVPANIVQGIGGLVIYFVIGYARKKGKVYKDISVR